MFNKRKWYDVVATEDTENGWGKESDKIINVAQSFGFPAAWYRVQEIRFNGVYATKKEIKALVSELGKDKYRFRKAGLLQRAIFKDEYQHWTELFDDGSEKDV